MEEVQATTKMFKGGDPSNPANWLECLPWNGYGKQFPTGYIIPPGIRSVINFIRYIVLMDAESDEGFKIVTKSEYRDNKEKYKELDIIGVQLNENSLAMVAGPKGLDSENIIIVDPQSGTQYTRLGWYNNHSQTDGLAMIAGNRFIRSVYGEGIHFGGNQ